MSSYDASTNELEGEIAMDLVQEDNAQKLMRLK